MELKAWFDEERGRITRLAQAMTAENPSRPVHGAFLGAMAAGTRPVPARLAPAIERLTCGAVMRWELRPEDWWEIWPEHCDRRGAPDVPAKADAVAA